MRVLLVQPPRSYWPYISEGDNFLLPQALPALAAPLVADGMDVRVLDCMPLKLGWRSLAEAVRRFDPQVVGCGENHALYVSEALRFFKLCRDIVPNAVTVAGGAHFTNLWHRYIGRRGEDPDPYGIDVVVVGEGEITFLELCRELAHHQPDLSSLLGIAYAVDGHAVLNPPRPLLADLDALPLPAYDLVPMHRYGTSRFLFSPGGTTVHHSRGCTSNCSFCAWWTTMADRHLDAEGNTLLQPRWRTKSVDRMMEELEILYYRHGKRSLVWVDESWNIDPAFNEGFADAMLRSGMKTTWFSFMRADCIIRDEELGILEKMVRAGLSHICVGVERAEDTTLESLNKRFYTGGMPERALQIFKQRYPRVFLQGTFIVGVREESPESLRRQLELAKRLDIDFPAFHPITPVPGTPIYDEALREGWITEDDFDGFDWLTPVLDSKYMTRHEIEATMYEMNKVFVNPRWLARGLLERVPYKRDMYIWFALVSARMALAALKQRLNPFSVENYQQLITPDWYES